MDQENKNLQQKESQTLMPHNLEKEKDLNEEASESIELPLDSESEAQEELFEEVMVRPRMFYVLLGLLSILIIGVGIGSYLTYPFSSKISGTWENPTLGMALTSNGNSWTAKIDSYQGVEGYTLLYKGQWQAAGVNTYDAKQTKVQVLLDKQKIPAKEIKELQKENPLYKKITDDKKILQIEYTETGIKKLFGKTKIDPYFHFTLEPITFQKNKRILYLNHPYFSPERVPFRFEE